MTQQLHLNFGPQPGAIRLLPLRRNERAARDFATYLMTLPNDQRPGAWRRRMNRLVRQRVAAGVPRAVAVADVTGFATVVRAALAYGFATPKPVPFDAPTAEVIDLDAARNRRIVSAKGDAPRGHRPSQTSEAIR